MRLGVDRTQVRAGARVRGSEALTRCLFRDDRYLDVCYNAIERLPPQCGSMVAMERLLVSDNKIAELPAEVRVSGHMPRTTWR